MATQRHRKPENFLNGVARNGHGLSEEMPLDPATRAVEALLVGLRLAEGVDLARIRRPHDLQKQCIACGGVGGQVVGEKIAALRRAAAHPHDARAALRHI